MKQQSNKHHVGGIAALLLFAVFAVGILSVLLGGAGAYRRLTARDSMLYEQRTCLQYLSTRLHQASDPKSIAVSRFGSSDALIIYDEIDGSLYQTSIYCHDGWLMELFTAAGGSFSPADGEKILPAQSLSLQQQNGLLRIFVTDSNGKTHTLYSAQNAGEAEE